jgi:hypothetical protein
MARGDRAIGIALGVVIGLVVIVLFVFVFSEDTVDPPSIGGGATTAPAPTVPATQPGSGSP